MRIIVGLILLTAIYGAYHMIAGIIADDLEDDGQTFFGAKIFTGAILLLAVNGLIDKVDGRYEPKAEEWNEPNYYDPALWE